MQIALVSDTHGRIDRLEILLENLQKNNINTVIHAGDMAVYGVEKIFEKFEKINFYIAQGNCDVNFEIINAIKKLPNCVIQEVIYEKFCDVNIGVSHIPGIAQKKLSEKKVDIFCHGHTHREQMEKINNSFILNPGALCEDGNFFVIDLPKINVLRKNIFFN